MWQYGRSCLRTRKFQTVRNNIILFVYEQYQNNTTVTFCYFLFLCINDIRNYNLTFGDDFLIFL